MSSLNWRQKAKLAVWDAAEKSWKFAYENINWYSGRCGQKPRGVFMQRFRNAVHHSGNPVDAQRRRDPSGFQILFAAAARPAYQPSGAGRRRRLPVRRCHSVDVGRWRHRRGRVQRWTGGRRRSGAADQRLRRADGPCGTGGLPALPGRRHPSAIYCLDGRLFRRSLHHRTVISFFIKQFYINSFFDFTFLYQFILDFGLLFQFILDFVQIHFGFY